MNDWKISELVSIVSAGTFLLSLLYVYGYSVELGLNLFLYFQLTDYLRLAIEWLTPLLTVGLIGGLVHKFFTRVERGASEEEIAATSPNPEFTRKFRRYGDAGLTVVIVVAALFNTGLSLFAEVPRERLYFLWGIAGFMMWLAAVNWYMKEPRLVKHWGKQWTLVVTLLPALAIFSFFAGLHGATTGHRFMGARADVEVLPKGSEPVTGQLLFTLEDYILLRVDETRRITVIPKGEIVRILYPKSAP